MKTIQRYGTVLRIYDNGGATWDRFTIIPPRWARKYVGRPGVFAAIGASDDPFHGYGQHVSAVPGKHLGKRVKWDDLPEPVQRFARLEFPEYAPTLKKYAENFRDSLPEAIFKWANSCECVLSLSGVKTLLRYGLDLDGLKLWNTCVRKGNTRGLRALVGPTVKVSYGQLRGHGKTYQLQEFKNGAIVRDSVIFRESQV